nr:FecR family protein [uncultured Dyadobacter sp.]
MNYRHYQVNDFVTDPVFRSWVLQADRSAAAFWERWLAENPDRREEVSEARAFLYVLEGRPSQVGQEELDERVNATLQRLRADSPSRNGRATASLYRYLGVAAMVCVLSGLGWLMNRSLHDGQGDKGKLAGIYHAKNGHIVHYNYTAEAVTLTLEDGSTVALKPESELEYPEKFEPANRVVELKGEAFFEVTRDPDRPFRVMTRELVTQVLGTSFTVRSFEKDANASVSVRTGRVSVYSKTEGPVPDAGSSKKVTGVVLKPNQQVLFDKRESRLVKVIVDEPVRVAELPVAALVFDEMPVKNVFKALEKEYGIEIVLNEEVLSACLLTANLSGLPMYQQLDLICRIIHARYEVMDGQVVIHSEGCKPE